MSHIKSTRDMKDQELARQFEEEDAQEGEQHEADLKDPSKWKVAGPEETAMIEAAVESLRKRMGRPRAEKPFKSIHINLPLDLLDELRSRAAKLNIGYQTYIKMALTKHVDNDEGFR